MKLFSFESDAMVRHSIGFEAKEWKGNNNREGELRVGLEKGWASEASKKKKLGKNNKIKQ